MKNFLMLLMLLFVPSFLLGQNSGGGLWLTVTQQPLEAFKGATKGPIRGLALYEAMTCNIGESSRIVTGGEIAQIIQSRIPTVSTTLLATTLERGRKRSKFYAMAVIGRYVARSATILLVGEVVPASQLVKVGAIFVGEIADELTKIWKTEEGENVTIIPGFLDPTNTYHISGHSCQTQLVLGRYVPDFKTIMTDLHVPLQ